jgi:hypothetical protein
VHGSWHIAFGTIRATADGGREKRKRDRRSCSFDNFHKLYFGFELLYIEIGKMRDILEDDFFNCLNHGRR